MKNSDEMTASLFQRRAQYLEEQKKKKQIFLKTGGTVLSLCLIALLGFAVWRAGRPGPTVPSVTPEQTDGAEKATASNPVDTQTPSVTTPEGSNPPEADVFWDENGICTPSDEMRERNGKSMTARLAEILAQTPSDAILEIAAYPPFDSNYAHGDQTLGEAYRDYVNAWTHRDMLRRLLEEGEILKYGTDVYETGTPDGIRWSKEQYEERIFFYGESFLAKYIADGVFRSDLAEEDLKQAVETDLTLTALNDIYSAYLSDLAAVLPESCFAQPDPVSHRLILSVTQEGLDALTSSLSPSSGTTQNMRGWTFDLTAPREESVPAAEAN